MRNRVLRRPFWHIADVPLVVQEWTPDTESSKPDLTAIPLWVDLKGVPGHLFSQVGLTFFVDTIGKTANIHPNTVRCTRLDVARLLVVMNLEKPLPDSVLIRGRTTTIQVSYPWLPPRCSLCNNWGHTDKECGKAKGANSDSRKEKKISSKTKQTEATNDTILKYTDDTILEIPVSTDVRTDEPRVSEEGKPTDSMADPHTSIVDTQSNIEKYWRLVGNGHKASPRRKVAQNSSENKTNTRSPSRFHLLADVEEGEVELSCSEEEETEEIVYIHNYNHHRLGKICVVWSDNVNVTVLYKSSQIITVWVTSSTGEQFLCSCIYASNFQNERRHLWSDLINIGSQYASPVMPWIIMGDFNETLSSSEHSIGVDPQNQSGMRDFQAAVSTCNLTDLDEQPFTLQNPSRDAALGKKRPFKFFNFLADHPDFTTIVAESWNSAEPLYHSRSALYLFHRKLKQLKSAIRLLNKSRFGNIPLRAKEAFKNLCDMQEQALVTPNTASFNSVSEAMATWNHWASIEERFYMQKFRITWLMYGDQNTIFSTR
ncbi:PREDICTED: uncharacterized protein LOC106338497 [Brassica oleracea var. oleracea]|uniref:uncharacterized protein LOC106338497 n=1 Tax=Brassica oleracea var. oleracea TaxID=109376 RepID=UPI0006A72185|nr:PREDICTED: uncharacterized protein LOC106338497 [Brassica oleracea var. oleracea]